MKMEETIVLKGIDIRHGVLTLMILALTNISIEIKTQLIWRKK